MASEYKLKLLYREEFHDIYDEHHEHPEFGPLLQRMKVVDSQGESQMDVYQWEAASKSIMTSWITTSILIILSILFFY